MTTAPSFVSDAAAVVVRAAADAIGPTAASMRANAATLVFTPRALAEAMETAILGITSTDDLEALAFNGLADLEAVAGSTANRELQAANQAAIVGLLRGLATIQFAEQVGISAYRDRTRAVGMRDLSGDALDERAADADTTTFTSLTALRAAVVEHINGLLGGLPRVIRAAPSTVQPSLVIAYSIYDDIDRAGEIVGRNVLPRPGFVPARPIELVSE